jgi:hypothetical protein
VAASVGFSVATGSVVAAVTGGGDPATFVLVAPPPQAASTKAASANSDKSTLIFLIYQTPSLLGYGRLKKNTSRRLSIGCYQSLQKLDESRTFAVETFCSGQCDIFETSLIAIKAIRALG